MEKIILVLLGVSLLISCEIIPEVEAPKNAYFLLGQSNASSPWVGSIKDEISKHDPNAVFVSQKHGGSSIKEWFDGEPKENYISDINLIKESLYGMNFNLKAIFWFQGESDKNLSDEYGERFYSLFNQLSADINDYDYKIITTIVDSPTLNCDLIRNIQMEISNNNENIYHIDSREYKRFDDFHLIASEARRLGKNTAELYLSTK
jgi:hypothetical protein